MDEKLLEYFTNYKLASEKKDAYWNERKEMEKRIDLHRELEEQVDKEADTAFNDFRNYVFDNF